jgi:hypothetical protein
LPALPARLEIPKMILFALVAACAVILGLEFGLNALEDLRNDRHS